MSRADDSKYSQTHVQPNVLRDEAFGQRALSRVDRFGVWLSQKPIRAVVRRYNMPTVLDLGCGYEAHMLRATLPFMRAGVGVDVHISDNAKALSALTFYEQPIETALMQLHDQKFEVVLMISVLEHLWEPQITLNACRTLLQPGGSLVINVPTWLGKTFLELSAFKLGQSGAFEIDDHKNYYDARNLWPMLVRAGFKPSCIQLRYHKFGLNLFGVARA